MNFFDVILFWFEQSGLSTGELVSLFFVGALLSPLPRMLVVFGAIRLGFNGFPGKFVCLGLAIALSIIQFESVLSPIIKKSAELNLTSKNGTLSFEAKQTLLRTAEGEWSRYIDANVSKTIWDKFLRNELPATQSVNGQIVINQISLGRIATAFLISELDKAFRAALIILLPLLIVEILTATAISALDVEVSTGLISFPLKLALFLSTSGWSLITDTLLKTNG